jgi:hypothetical protein
LTSGRCRPISETAQPVVSTDAAANVMRERSVSRRQSSVAPIAISAAYAGASSIV